MARKLGGYWTAIDLQDGGWVMRDHHASVEEAMEYAASQKMTMEGRVVILQEVGEIREIETPKYEYVEAE